METLSKAPIDQRQWVSGKLKHSHCLAPGSIPGWRTFSSSFAHLLKADATRRRRAAHRIWRDSVEYSAGHDAEDVALSPLQILFFFCFFF